MPSVISPKSSSLPRKTILSDDAATNALNRCARRSRFLAHRRAQEPADWVDPFVGTTNFGTTNPGAVCPNGMMSVVPFNVMGSDENVYD
ncbi:MAG: hypothetical protein ACLUFW_10750 [Alistipes sp.]